MAHYAIQPYAIIADYIYAIIFIAIITPLIYIKTLREALLARVCVSKAIIFIDITLRAIRRHYAIDIAGDDGCH